MASLGMFPNVRMQEFDNKGRPLTGGFIYAYQSGTDTPATLYKDGQGLVEHPWPLVLDDAGSAKVYLLPIAYKIVIKDQFGVLIEERDPVYSNAFIGGSDQTGTWGVVDNYNALRNLTQQYDAVFVLGRATPGDGGSGIFVLDPDNTNIDDDGTILVRSTTDRYVRELSGYIEPAWFGCVYGASNDNSAAFTKAVNAGLYWGLPVTISGSLYFGANYNLATNSRININGAITGPNGVVFRFKQGSALLSAYKNAFNSNIQPIFEQGICDELRVSWFAGGFSQLIASSVYDYQLTVDKDVTVSANLTIPANFEVDFIAGSKLVVSSLADIVIENLVYNGTGTIVFYQDKSFIGKVKVGASYCYLEWFGGVAGSAIDTDNAIAFKAGVSHGYIYLISSADKFYNIPSGTYNNATGLVLQGNYIPNNSTVNDLVPSTIRLAAGAAITTGKMTVTGVKINGSGSITATESTLTNAIISNAVTYSTGLSKVNDSIGTLPQYVGVGSSGKVVYSSDVSGTWTQVSPVLQSINSVVRGSNLYVAVGGTGLVMTSPDAVTWTTRTSGTTVALYKVKWITETSRYVAVGDSGKVLYSTDGISWNNTTVATASLRSVSYFNGKYIVTGTNGDIYTSPDIFTWTKKVVSGITQTIYDVAANPTQLVLVGGNGTIITSADAVNFTVRLTSTTNSLLTVAWYADDALWVVGGGNTTLLKSADGINFSIINTYTGIVDPLNAQVKINGQYLFACGDGYIITSFDLATFQKFQPVNAVNLNGIAAKQSFVLAIGDSGAVATSTDGVSYTVTTPTTVNLNRVKQIDGVYYIVGASGNYLFSYDALTWTQKSAGTANLYDIVGVGGLFTVVGSAGTIKTSNNPTVTSPTWTARTSNVSVKLASIVKATSQYVIIGDDATVLLSTDSITWTASNYVSNGLVAGSVKLIFGDAGLVLTSTDMISWVKRTSGTTANITCGAWSGTLFALGTATGGILTSPDGVTWTTRTSNTTNPLTKIVYASGKFVAVGSNGTVIKSTDGITWSSAYGTATSTTFLSVRFLGSTFVVTGSAGFLMTSPDLTTWTARSTGTTQDIRDAGYNGTNYAIIGSAGYIAYSSDLATWSAASTLGSATQLNAILGSASGFVVLGNAGYGLTSTDGRSWSALTTDTTSNLYSVAIVGTDYYAVGTALTLVKSTDLVIWKLYIDNPSGTSADLSSIYYDGTDYALVTGPGNLRYSKDALVWLVAKTNFTDFTKVTKIGATWTLFGVPAKAVTYTASSLTGTWAQQLINSVPSSITSVTSTSINGAALTVYFTAAGKAITGGSTGLAISFTKVSLYNVIADVAIVNTIAGEVSSSQLLNVALIGRTTDSTISNFSGALVGAVNRSEIDFSQSITVNVDAVITDSTLKRVVPTKFDVFKLAAGVTNITLNNTNINAPGSMLVYSVDAATKINISGGTLAGGNATALSNGYAKIYLNNVFDENADKVSNISAYSLDGKVLDDDLVNVFSNNTISSDLTHWFHPQKASMSVSDNSIVLGAATVLASDIASANTIRYRWGTTALRFLKNFGGRIRTTIEFPAGADKEMQAKTKIKAKLYIPVYKAETWDYDTLKNTAVQNTAFIAGNTVSAGSSVDAAKILSYTNVWSGRQDMLPALYNAGNWYDNYGKNNVKDSYGDVSFVMRALGSTGKYDTSWIFGHPILNSFGDPIANTENTTQEAYVVVFADTDVTLPIGTKLKVELIMDIPKSLDIFHTFYGADDDYSIDPHSSIETVYLHYKGIDDGTWKMSIVKNGISETKDEKKYLSVVDKSSYNSGTSTWTYYQVDNAYEWVDSYGLTHHQFMQPTTTLQYTQGSIDYDVTIKLNGLLPNPSAAKTFGGSGSSVVGTNNVQVSGTSAVIANPYFAHTLEAHSRLRGETNFRMIDKVLTYNFFNGL